MFILISSIIVLFLIFLFLELRTTDSSLFGGFNTSFNMSYSEKADFNSELSSRLDIMSGQISDIVKTVTDTTISNLSIENNINIKKLLDILNKNNKNQSDIQISIDAIKNQSKNDITNINNILNELINKNQQNNNLEKEETTEIILEKIEEMLLEKKENSDVYDTILDKLEYLTNKIESMEMNSLKNIDSTSNTTETTNVSKNLEDEEYKDEEYEDEEYEDEEYENEEYEDEEYKDEEYNDKEYEDKEHKDENQEDNNKENYKDKEYNIDNSELTSTTNTGDNNLKELNNNNNKEDFDLDNYKKDKIENKEYKNEEHKEEEYEEEYEEEEYNGDSSTSSSTINIDNNNIEEDIKKNKIENIEHTETNIPQEEINMADVIQNNKKDIDNTISADFNINNIESSTENNMENNIESDDINDLNIKFNDIDENSMTNIKDIVKESNEPINIDNFLKQDNDTEALKAKIKELSDKINNN